MDNINPTIDIQQKILAINPDLAFTLIHNAKYFQMTGLFGNSYDMATFFDHKNGNRYCVIHTLFGPLYQNEFIQKINESEWRISISTSEFKRECIRQFMIDNNCSMDYVYNIMENSGYEESEWSETE